jgi:hypothetical protein
MLMIHEIINYASTFPIIATWSVKLVPTVRKISTHKKHVDRRGLLKKEKEKKKKDIFSWNMSSRW